jgi:hypothetical protein
MHSTYMHAVDGHIDVGASVLKPVEITIHPYLTTLPYFICFNIQVWPPPLFWCNLHLGACQALIPNQSLMIDQSAAG